MHALDRIDRKILDILQRQGRISMTELGSEIGLSTSPCAERVRRLERSGVITGYHAHVNPQALGKTVLVFVELTLSTKSGEIFDRVRKELMHMPEVLECHLIAGGFDYLVKARVRDMEAYREFLSEVLMTLPGVRETHTYPVMEEVKNTTVLPV